MTLSVVNSRTKRKQQRLLLILVCSTVLALAIGLILFALSDQIVFFQTPTDIVSGVVEPGIRVRIGGLVEAESIKRLGETIQFGVTDEANRFTASYTGILPDLFREGQGVVLEGALGQDGTFMADTVLAKHDENYMPKEVAEALEQSNQWKGGPS